jgi:hypothetical protein
MNHSWEHAQILAFEYYRVKLVKTKLKINFSIEILGMEEEV